MISFQSPIFLFLKRKGSKLLGLFEQFFQKIRPFGLKISKTGLLLVFILDTDFNLIELSIFNYPLSSKKIK